MLEYPKTKDLLEIAAEGLRRRDYEQTDLMIRALDLARALLEYPWIELEEKDALKAYFSEQDLNVQEGRCKLAREIREGALPVGPESVRLKDCLLKTIVPYLRIANPKYIVQRQKEKRGSESAI